MAQYPTFDLDVPAYLTDTFHLTYREHGIYLVLLMQLWVAPGQRFPNDDSWLARKFRMAPEEVQNDLRPIIEEFCATDGNWITQRRLTREFAKAKERSKKQSVRAKSRWKKEKAESRGDAHDGNAPRARFTDTGTESSDTNVSGTNGAYDPVKVIFDAGVRLLTEAGVSNSQARSFLGKLRKKHNDESIIKAISAAQKAGAVDPTSYITGALRETGPAEMKVRGGALI